MKRVSVIAMMVFVLFMSACAMFQGGDRFPIPDDFTPGQKVEFTTLKTLEAASTFRVFALTSAGTIYKRGLMDEEVKDKIIEIGNDLQRGINTAADALILYHKTNGENGYGDLDTALGAYQLAFNQFIEIVTPYLMNAKSGGE